MSKLLPCKHVCPIVAELKHEIACLKKDTNSLRKSETRLKARLNIMTGAKRDDEIRIQRAKEALFSIPDSNITGGP